MFNLYSDQTQILKENSAYLWNIYVSWLSPLGSQIQILNVHKFWNTILRIF
jgi:hypothetical protein